MMTGAVAAAVVAGLAIGPWVPAAHADDVVSLTETVTETPQAESVAAEPSTDSIPEPDAVRTVEAPAQDSTTVPSHPAASREAAQISAAAVEVATSITMTAQPGFRLREGVEWMTVQGHVSATDGRIPTGTIETFLDTTRWAFQTVSAEGRIGVTGRVPSAGHHVFRMVFTPAEGSGFAPSSAEQPLEVVRPIATAVSLEVSPGGGAAAGETVTLTARATAGIPGRVYFDLDLRTSPLIPVDVDGVARYEWTVSRAEGAVSALQATFFPDDSVQYDWSLSEVVPYVIEVPPQPTTTTLTASPDGRAGAGQIVTFSARVVLTGTTNRAPGNVEFVVDGSVVDTKPVLRTGYATSELSWATAGSRTVLARYVPLDPAVYVGSDATLTYRVGADPTSTTLAVAPSPAVAGSPVTVTATVAPSAAGTVTFYDGEQPLGMVRLVDGRATLATSALAAGSLSLRAQFVPDDATAFAASASAVSALDVIAPVASVANAAATVSQGATLVVRGGGFVPGTPVTAVIHSDPVTLGTSVADASGAVTFAWAVPAGFAPGAHTVELSVAGTVVASVGVTVTASAAGASPVSAAVDTLAATGTDPAQVGMWAGFGMLLLGVAAMSLVRSGRVTPARR